MPRIKKLILFTGLSFLALIILLAGLVRQRYTAPIIMYHYVHYGANAGDKLVVTPEVFQRQMRFLKERRYNVIPLEELAVLIKEKKKIPARAIAITIDDGHKDNYNYIFPVLKKYGLPAAMFVIVNEIGRPQNDRLSWGEIKEMRDSGLISFGSHALGAEPLVNIRSEEELKRQIYASKKILEEKLGKEVKIFSYPEGLFNAKIKKMVTQAGYLAAVSTSPGISSPSDDIFALKRQRISQNAGNLFIFYIQASGYYGPIKEFQRSFKKR